MMRGFFTEHTSSGRYFAPLTGLRGLAALLVVLFHVVETVPIAGTFHPFFEIIIRPLYGYGFLGVNLFFVLSGFLLSFSFLSAKKHSLKKFALNRCLRVLPSYYAQLAILIIGAGVIYDEWTNGYNVILHLLMLHNFDNTTNSAINGVYWTLPVEWQFYYVMPLCALLFLKNRWIWLIIGAIVFGSLARLFVGEILLASAKPLTRVWLLAQCYAVPEHFLFGMAAAYWRHKLTNNAWAIRYGDLLMLIGAGWFGMCVSIIDWNAYWENSQHYWWNAIAPAGLALFVFGVSANRRFAHTIFANKLMLTLGILSYSIYLWHLIPIRLFDKWKLSAKLAENGVTDVNALCVATIAVLLLTLMISYINYRVIERPFLSLKP